jgi:putative ABC transport system permease protein
MTATTVAPPAPGAVAPPRRERTTSKWRVATRLARREVRRRWGRTLLVMLLVAVPVFGMVVVTVLVRTTHSNTSQEFARQFGRANLVGVGSAATPAGGWPAGTEIVRGREVGSLGLVAGNTARLAKVTDIDLDSPVVRGAVLLRAGRFPRVAGEALVSPKLAKAFHVHVGDELRLTEPAWTERVVGIGVAASDWSDGFLAVRGDELAGRPDFSFEPVQQVTLVRLRGHPSTADLKSYAPQYMSSVSDTNSGARAVDWTLVGGMIALAIVGVVISGAFAVGARRQLVTLGQLSANGAGESLLRRMLSLQGAWCGALGAALGLASGAITLVLMHARFNGWAHRDIGPFVWSPRDLVAIGLTGLVAATIAAFVPARTAARVPVLSALAGRRPLGALPRSIVPIGIALFGSGVLVLVLVAAASRNGGGDGLALAAVLGGLLVLSGACCVSPVLVSSLGHIGRFVHGSGRVAVRSIVRSRARSAAVVMALAAINAGAIAMSTAFASGTEKTGAAAPFMPDDALVVAQRVADPITGVTTGFLPLPQSVERTLRTIVPKADWSERRAVLGVTVTNDVPRQKGLSIKVPNGSDFMVVADPAIVRLIGLSHADAATLRRNGVLALPSPFGSNEPGANRVSLTVGSGARAQTLTAPLAAHHLRAIAGVGTLVTAAKARELGLPIVSAGAVVTNPSSFDESQRASLDALSSSLSFGAKGSSSVSATRASSASTEILWSGPRSNGISPNTVKQIILGIVVLVALIVLAMSLALSAAETRDERDVLVALGAPPATMRGLAAWKAWLLSFSGAALAVPVGFIPVAFVYLASVRPDERARLGFPWSTTAELVIAAPLIAAFVAAIGSSVAQRVRPTKMSTFATD